MASRHNPSENPWDTVLASGTRLNGVGRPCMTPAERAKIFMPFNPLKGFQEALREKEAEAEARDDLLWHKSPFEDEE